MNGNNAHYTVDAIKDRLATASAQDLRLSAPEQFQTWFRGDLRPAVLTDVIEHSGLNREILAEALEADISSILAAEEGRVYPSWARVCALAAVLQVPLARLLPAVPENPHPVEAQAGYAETVDALMRASFHPDVYGPIVNSDFGLTGTGLTDDVINSASEGADRAEKEATATAAELHGFPEMAKALRAGGDPQVELIRTGFAERLQKFRHDLFNSGINHTHTTPARTGAEQPGPTPGTHTVTLAEALELRTSTGSVTAAMGPVPSMTERNLALNFVADLTPKAGTGEDANPAGGILTISISAHDRNTHERRPVPEPAARRWLRAAIGDEWASQLVNLGTRSGSGNGGLSTEYYQLHLSPEGKPVPPSV